MNEEWIILQINALNKNGAVSPRQFTLTGYSSLTKEKLHEYGPFNLMEELIDFTLSHGITL